MHRFAIFVVLLQLTYCANAQIEMIQKIGKECRASLEKVSTIEYDEEWEMIHKKELRDGGNLTKGTGVVRRKGDWIFTHFIANRFHDKTLLDKGNGTWERFGVINDSYFATWMNKKTNSSIRQYFLDAPGKLTNDVKNLLHTSTPPDIWNFAYKVSNRSLLELVDMFEDSSDTRWQVEEEVNSDCELHFVVQFFQSPNLSSETPNFKLDINADKGYVIEKEIGYDANGKILSQKSIEYMQLDTDIWFPQKITKTSESDDILIECKNIKAQPEFTENDFAIEAFGLEKSSRATLIKHFTDGTFKVYEHIDGELVPFDKETTSLIKKE